MSDKTGNFVRCDRGVPALTELHTSVSFDIPSLSLNDSKYLVDTSNKAGLYDINVVRTNL